MIQTPLVRVREWYNTLENNLIVFIKLIIYPVYDLKIALLDTHLREMKTCLQKVLKSIHILQLVMMQMNKPWHKYDSGIEISKRKIKRQRKYPRT